MNKEKIKERIGEIIKGYPISLNAFPRSQFEEQLTNFIFKKLKNLKEIEE